MGRVHRRSTGLRSGKLPGEVHTREAKYPKLEQPTFKYYWTCRDNQLSRYYTADSNIEPEYYPTRAIPTQESGECLAAYEYAALTTRQIRLLVLYPGSDQEELRGSFELPSLDDEIYYKAISYAWGPPTFTETLYLPEGILKITPSLAGALRRFRHPSKYTRIWADAVCINQNDVHERSQQVSMMADIYRDAEMVLIWLGDAAVDDAQRFNMMWFLAAIWQEYERHNSETETWPWSWTKRKWQAHYEQYFDTDGRDDVACICCGETSHRRSHTPEESILLLSSLLTRSWFTRLWVYQECALAKRAFVFCGKHFMLHSLFTEAVMKIPEALRGLQLAGRRENLLEQAWETASITIDATQSVRISQTSHTSPGAKLAEMVIDSCELACSEPRDRIFALLSFVPNSGLDIDYGITLHQLWRRFTVEALSDSRSWVSDLERGASIFSPSLLMAMGAAAQHEPLDHRRMSWVADLNFPPLRIRDMADRYVHTSELYAGGHMVSKDSPKVLVSRALCMRGFILSQIYNLCPRSQWPGTPKPWDEAFKHYVVTTLLPWYFRCQLFLRQHGGDIMSNRELKDIVQQGDYTGDRHTRLTLQEFEALFLRAREPDRDTSSHGRYSSAEAYFHLGSMLSRTRWEFDYLDQSWLLAMDSTGRFCWVPEKSKPGDCIALLEGTPFPWIMRKAENGCYMLLGDAYVHGVMRGEKWPLSPFFELSSEEGNRLERRLTGDCYAEEGKDPALSADDLDKLGTLSLEETFSPKPEVVGKELLGDKESSPPNEGWKQRWEEYYSSFERLNEERGHLLEEIHLV